MIEIFSVIQISEDDDRHIVAKIADSERLLDDEIAAAVKDVDRLIGVRGKLKVIYILKGDIFMALRETGQNGSR